MIISGKDFLGGLKSLRHVSPCSGDDGGNICLLSGGRANPAQTRNNSILFYFKYLQLIPIHTSPSSRKKIIPANPRDQNLCHHHCVLSSARPLGVAVRQGRCRMEDRRKPLSGRWSESGFPPVCKMAGRACEAHMRTGERYCDSSIFPGAAATSASPRIKRAPPSPQRNRSCPSSNTERGAGRRHILYFVPALSSAPAK